MNESVHRYWFFRRLRRGPPNHSCFASLANVERQKNDLFTSSRGLLLLAEPRSNSTSLLNEFARPGSVQP